MITLKHLATTVLIFLTMLAKRQNFKTLKEISSGDTILTGQAIIYGNFIQRLGFGGGGFHNIFD